MKRGNHSTVSPWLHQMHRTRPLHVLASDQQTDVAIVGGGIAGISTAYFLLKNTNKKVLLVEGSKIAHGATGHNAGQVVAYFEKPFSEIAEEHGIQKAAQAQKDIINTWETLFKIIKDAKIKTPLTVFQGYAGCATVEQLIIHLHNKELREKQGISMETIYVANDKHVLSHISRRYKGHYKVVPHKKILEMLNTNHKHFIAALSTQKGTLNSAMFTEELCGHLLKKHPKRFKVFENAHVKKVELFKKGAILYSHKKIKTKKAVLCTNGFEHVKIINNFGDAIDKKFHERVQGLVSHMAGYLQPKHYSPEAISYFDSKESDPSATYFYLTRRKYELEKDDHLDLVCIGGPEYSLKEKSEYKKEKKYHPHAERMIKKFLENDYLLTPKKLKFNFFWHGLMGYTNTGVRLVGEEPCNNSLLYNLGCNGVGILPSIYGGKRISELISGKKLKPTIFDPIDQRCLTK
jgi:glycine/D-amino acid oxidase-like deaminating enzyme